ncbi:homoprotocatechuate degradation operon regulator HpaR [Rhodobacterales bacterium HKCCE3408]|nr:homoprotocatechuate degradation operon regulator HpaR [Rhodobacterales bacterium HKCCE3408]
MTDQRQIQTATLSTTERSLPIALLRARERIMERFRPILAAHGVTEQQWRVLRVLQEADELDAGELAVRSCILAPSLTRMLKALEDRALVSSRRDPTDGRRLLIRLADGGVEFIAEISPQSASVYVELEREIGGETVATLLEQLDKVIAALDRSR